MSRVCRCVRAQFSVHSFASQKAGQNLGVKYPWDFAFAGHTVVLYVDHIAVTNAFCNNAFWALLVVCMR